MQDFEKVALEEWFQAQKRSLPWRKQPSPYAVWVSEIMLQQTQVAVVIPYFNRWMELFPTIEALAAAPLESVIKAWEGLGYYSRARNLHAGAGMVVRDYGGQLPIEASELSKIKGIGPYTVGAIRSFAFHQKAAAVDGNVIRVLARYFQITEDVCQPKILKRIWQMAAEILPEEKSWIFSEALIELGATVCTKKPKCRDCPLKRSCQGYVQGTAEELPYKSFKVKAEKLYRAVAVIISPEEALLVKHVQTGKVMSGLHEFPYFELTSEEIQPDEIKRWVEARFELEIVGNKVLPKIQHSFTRYQVSLFPHYFYCRQPLEVSEYRWMSPDESDKAAFSAGHRRLYQMVREGNCGLAAPSAYQANR